VTVEVAATVDELSIVADWVPPGEKVAVWVDGVYAVANTDTTADPPYLGHSWQLTGAYEYDIVIDRAILPVEPGDATVTIASRTVDQVTTFTDAVVDDVPGDPTPFVLPTVSTGQTLTTPTVRSLFNLSPSVVDADDIAADLMAAGVNCVEIGIFNNPADQPAWNTFELWQAAFEATIGVAVDWCIANGFDFLGGGDNLMRFAPNREWLATSPFAEQAVRYTAARLRDSGVCRGVEMVDEVGNNVENYGPIVEDFVFWWTDEGGPLLAWPDQGPYLWEVPELSGYSSRYLATGDWIEWKGKSPNPWLLWRSVRHAADLIPTARPWSCLASVSGPFYQKELAGDDYQEGDTVIGGPILPETIITQVWLALAYGASRFRSYAYDFAHWRDYRANQTPGEFNPIGLQTGTRPGDVRWPGLVAAYNSVASREEALAGTPFAPTFSGQWVFGRRGSLVWGVNLTTRALPSPNGPGDIITLSGETFGSTVPAGGVILWTL
jgi:hypothetical protein